MPAMTHTFTTYGAHGARKEGLMASTLNFESECRDFAREFPTPNTQRAIALCEAGTLTWKQVHPIFKAALAKGISEVGA